ncbi:hypothetical protein [Salipiger mucosus]|nr:hypothetical protein [Salipiger mucosus]
MRQPIAIALAASLFAAPLPAQDMAPGDAPEETAPEEDGRSLMKRGADLFFRGLKDELDPALRELQDMAREIEPALRSFSEEMGPALRDLMDDVQDWSKYHPPEMLPNGDIILRRKDPLEEPLPGDEHMTDEGEGIDL